MEQKRKIKSLLPVKIDWKSWFLTALLLFLSVVMCVMSVSLMTSRVEAQGGVRPGDLPHDTPGAFTSANNGNGLEFFQILYNLDYVGAIDNEVEAVYAMRFLDPGDLTKFVNNIYMSGRALYITPNPVIVDSIESMENYYADNMVGSGIYGNVLGGEFNKVYSDNVTLIAGKYNEVVSGNDNVAILGGVGNKFGPGKVGGVPMLILGGSGNIMGTGHDNNALLGGEYNIIGENTSNVSILGGKNNVVSSDVENVIVGGTNVVVSGVSNVFAFSNSDERFYPLSSEAFYLNLSKGVGIGVDRNYPGISVSGAVSLGEIDLRVTPCNTGNRGVLGFSNGCLVGCVNNRLRLNESGHRLREDDTSWVLLDIGERCVGMQKEHRIPNCGLLFLSGDYGNACSNQGNGEGFSRPLGYGTQVNNLIYLERDNLHSGVRIRTGSHGQVLPYGYVYYGEEPYGHCTTGVVYVDNAHKCFGTGAESLYSSSVIFETSLIDSEDDDCPPLSGYENKCVYQCNSGYHLVKKTGIYKCQPDCQMNRNDSEPQTFRDGDKTIGFKNKVVDCVNTGGVNTNTCDDYKATLVCNLGKMRVEGTLFTAEEKGYVYSRCDMTSFSCDTNYYGLLSSDIGSIYDDTIDTANLNGETEVVGMRGVYKVCRDYEGGGDGSCEATTLHFRFDSCNPGYTLIDGKCMKDCTWKENGDTKHGIGRTFYTTGSVVCPGVCSGQLFTCNDGNWNGSNKDQYTYTSCNHTPKICDASYYNVAFSGYQQRSGNGQYESCENIAVTSNVCMGNNFVYKLNRCNTGYHTDDYKICVSNTRIWNCSTDKPSNSEWIGDGTYTETWSGTWDSGEWVNNSSEDCQWECNSGYHEDANGVCISDEVQCRVPDTWTMGTWEWSIGTFMWNGSYPEPTYVGDGGDDSIECSFRCVGSGYTGYVYSSDDRGCVSCSDYCDDESVRVGAHFYYHNGGCYVDTGGVAPTGGSCRSGFDLVNNGSRDWCYPSCEPRSSGL